MKQLKMNSYNMTSSDGIFSFIKDNNTQLSVAMKNGKVSETPFIRYRRTDNKELACFINNKTPKHIELMLKICNDWKPWVHVDDSSIPNAGHGLFASRNFRKHEYVTIYMGRKLYSDEIKRGRFSKYALFDRDPCDKKGRLTHWYLFAHLINHGNYTKSNLKFDPKLRAYTSKTVHSNNEFFIDYNRTIYCTTCLEPDEEDINGMVRTAIKPCKRGSEGKCSYCYSNKKQLVVRVCIRCRRKLCASCYDKIQVSL